MPHFKIPFVPIVEQSRKPYAMHLDILEYPWVLKPPVAFANRDELMESLLLKVIEPAERMFKQRQKLLMRLYEQKDDA